MMARLAAALQHAGEEVTVLTAAWQTDWPAQFEHHGVRTIRLPNPPARFWGTLRYMRAVAAWLGANRERFDLVYVSMLKHDAYAAIGALQQAAVPVVVRAEGAGKTGDCHWHQTARFGRRIQRRRDLVQRHDGAVELVGVVAEQASVLALAGQAHPGGLHGDSSDG